MTGARPRRAEILPPGRPASDGPPRRHAPARTFLGLTPRRLSTGWAVVLVRPQEARTGPRYLQHGVFRHPGQAAPSPELLRTLADHLRAYAPDVAALCSANFLAPAGAKPAGAASMEAALYEIAREGDTPVAAFAPSALARHLPRAPADPHATPLPFGSPDPASPDPLVRAAGLLEMPVVPGPPEAAMALAAALAAALAETAARTPNDGGTP